MKGIHNGCNLRAERNRANDTANRYSEGRKYWAQLILATQMLGRVFWIHAKEREGELGKKDVLAKL